MISDIDLLDTLTSKLTQSYTRGTCIRRYSIFTCDTLPNSYTPPDPLIAISGFLVATIDILLYTYPFAFALPPNPYTSISLPH